jgi:hypothetical protein
MDLGDDSSSAEGQAEDVPRWDADLHEETDNTDEEDDESIATDDGTSERSDN